MTVIERLHHHPFGVPTLEESYRLYSPNTSVVLGISYFASILSVFTGVPIKYFFGTLCAFMVFLVPLGAYYLARAGFRLSFRVSLLVAAVVGCSALVARTFYIDALGSLSVIAMAPIAVALCIQFVDQPSHRLAVLYAMLAAAMYYCYYPGFGLMAVISGMIFISALEIGRAHV